jgi:hypothetical protein
MSSSLDVLDISFKSYGDLKISAKIQAYSQLLAMQENLPKLPI